MNKIEQLRKNAFIKGAVALGAASMALAGCTTSAQEAREVLSPVERIDFEFGGDGVAVDGKEKAYGNACLKNTPYDPVVNDALYPALAKPSPEDSDEFIVTLIPAPAIYPEAEPLRITGFDDIEEPLKPVDASSGEILLSYGCIE